MSSEQKKVGEPVRVEIGPDNTVRVTNLKESFKDEAYYKALKQMKPLVESINQQKHGSSDN